MGKSLTMIDGFHHVTFLASDPRTVLDFAGGVLGLRLVKRTVADDDPGVARLTFGDSSGRPGTLLSFFVAPGFVEGKAGKGQTIQTILAAPEGTLDIWRQRLAEAGIESREGSGKTLFFPGPDGVGFGIIASSAPRDPDEAPDAPVSVSGIHGIVLASEDPSLTRAFLVRALGFEEAEGGYLYAGADPLANLVLIHPGGAKLPESADGAGTIHHVVFRVAGTAELDAAQRTLEQMAWPVERATGAYFHTLTFREPGGALVALATEGPGFVADEPLETLGSRLCLPAALEPHRAAIVAAIGPDAAGAGTDPTSAQP